MTAFQEPSEATKKDLFDFDSNQEIDRQERKLSFKVDQLENLLIDIDASNALKIKGGIRLMSICLRSTEVMQNDGLGAEFTTEDWRSVAVSMFINLS